MNEEAHIIIQTERREGVNFHFDLEDYRTISTNYLTMNLNTIIDQTVQVNPKESGLRLAPLCPV